jgi:hypothetical protein
MIVLTGTYDMAQLTELWTNRKEFRKTQIVDNSLPTVGNDEVLVAIDKFGLTANNVSYALFGDAIGHWNYYPTPAARWTDYPVPSLLFPLRQGILPNAIQNGAPVPLC